MQPKLIALAVAGAFAAPAAFAATANVDVYGVLNVAVERVDNGTAEHSRLTTGNNSALGFKGSEDLGGGLKGIWQIETNVGVDGDNGAALSGIRNTYLGLSGGFGTVLFGMWDTPYKTSTGRLDPFVATVGDYNSIMGAYSFYSAGTNPASVAGNASGQFDLRTGNTIGYISPNLSGFQVALAYVLSGEGNFGTNATFEESRVWSLSASYTSGPLYLVAAYEDHALKGASTTHPGISGGIPGNANDTHQFERNAWKVGAGYKFGDLSLGLIYENIEISKNTNINQTTHTGDRDAWHVNATYAMGPITLKAAYTDADKFGKFANTGAKQWSLGVDYSLSKRTKVYLVYADLENEKMANYTLSQGPNAVNSGGTGKDQDGFAIGVQHSF